MNLVLGRIAVPTRFRWTNCMDFQKIVIKDNDNLNFLLFKTFYFDFVGVTLSYTLNYAVVMRE